MNGGLRMSKEKANWEVTLKNILYYINNEKEQQKVLDILIKYGMILSELL